MADLEVKRLGRTGMTPKSLGLGCAWFGSAKSSDQDAISGIRHAIELGMDYVDTSSGYGESERRVGLALSGGWRESVYLQTKTGTHPDRPQDYTGEGTRWSVENSLRVLRVDYLDSVLIHDPADIEVPLAESHALDELVRLKEEGKIRHIGIGCRPHDFHKRAIETGLIEIVLTFLDYTLLDQSAAKTTMALAKSKGVGLILASILGMGRLTGVEPDRKEDPEAHAMWAWCRERNVSLPALAAQFCLRAPIEGIVMTGPCNQKEVQEVFTAATLEIAPELWLAFGEAFGIPVDLVSD